MKTLISLAALAAIMPFAPAAAQSLPTPAASRTVAYGDLDLGSAAGRATLERRVRRAALDVCGVPSGADLVGQNDTHACRKATTRAALTQVEAQLRVPSGAVRVATAR